MGQGHEGLTRAPRMAAGGTGGAVPGSSAARSSPAAPTVADCSRSVHLKASAVAQYVVDVPGVAAAAATVAGTRADVVVTVASAAVPAAVAG